MGRRGLFDTNDMMGMVAYENAPKALYPELMLLGVRTTEEVWINGSMKEVAMVTLDGVKYMMPPKGWYL